MIRLQYYRLIKKECNSMNNTTCIFILGMNGSGTHMLADCLNNHPLIYIHSQEILTIPYYYYNVSKYGDLQNENNFNKLLKDFCNNPGFLSCNKWLPLEIPINFDDLEEKNLSQVVHVTFSFFASKVKKSIWGEHSPKYALFIPQLIDLFPKSKIIHLIRDGRDNAQSLKRRFGHNIYRTIFQWKTLMKKARSDGLSAGAERYFEIRYEDLTNSPEYCMKNICSFLGVPFDARVLNSKMPMYEAKVLSRQKGTMVPNYGKWRKSFTMPQIKKLEGIAGETLVNLGYETMFKTGNKDIGRIRLFFLKWLDKIHVLVLLIFKRKYSIYRVGNAIMTSLKQNKHYKY